MIVLCKLLYWPARGVLLAKKHSWLCKPIHWLARRGCQSSENLLVVRLVNAEVWSSLSQETYRETRHPPHPYRGISNYGSTSGETKQWDQRSLPRPALFFALPHTHTRKCVSINLVSYEPTLWKKRLFIWPITVRPWWPKELLVFHLNRQSE